MLSDARFSIETIDGFQMGKLQVPYCQIADWLNFLVTPQYEAEIVSVEQDLSGVSIYFYANEGLYFYLHARLDQVPARHALAS